MVPQHVPGLAPRLAAAALLTAVLDQRKSLDTEVEAGDGPIAELVAADRSLARAIVSTALRHGGQIAAALDLLIERKLPSRAGALRRILEIASAQILFMAVPDHAAVSLALAAADRDAEARHFKALANGVLRNLVRQRDEILAKQDETRLNAPEWLWRSWVDAYGPEATGKIAAAHLAALPLDLTVKSAPGDWAARLDGALLPTGSIRLEGRGRIEEMTGFDDGAWWVQDAAAALPARLLGDVAGKSVLDLCAAPGGKTAQLANAGAKVTAVDISASRMRRLRGNLARLRLEAECVVGDAQKFDPGGTYDAVLVDPPCSSTGTIRRHPDLPWLKREADIAGLVGQQAAILGKATELTRPGGTIVFATCSLQPEEGEHQASAAASALPLDPWPILPGEIMGLKHEWLTNGCLRTLPFHQPGDGIETGMDGFFAARFRRL